MRAFLHYLATEAIEAAVRAAAVRAAEDLTRKYIEKWNRRRTADPLQDLQNGDHDSADEALRRIRGDDAPST